MFQLEFCTNEVGVIGIHHWFSPERKATDSEKTSLRSIDRMHRQINLDWVVCPWSPDLLSWGYEATWKNMNRSWSSRPSVRWQTRSHPCFRVLPQRWEFQVSFEQLNCLVCFEGAKNIKCGTSTIQPNASNLWPTANILSCYAGNWSFLLLHKIMLHILAQNLFAASRKSKVTLQWTKSISNPLATSGGCVKTWCNTTSDDNSTCSTTVAHHINISCFFFLPAPFQQCSGCFQHGRNSAPERQLQLYNKTIQKR